MSSGRTWRAWTTKEVEFVLRAAEDGMSHADVAARLGRSVKSVQMMAHKHDARHRTGGRRRSRQDEALCMRVVCAWADGKHTKEWCMENGWDRMRWDRLQTKVLRWCRSAKIDVKPPRKYRKLR